MDTPFNQAFISGVVIGSLNKIADNIKPIGTKLFEWKELSDAYEFQINYLCGHYLSELKRLEEMLESFAHVKDIVVTGGGGINIQFYKE